MDCLEEDLWTALTTQVCYIATDGSAPNGKGSFAWVISDSNGTILVKSKGPVYGANITSFRAEGYGILAILRFLLRMKQVHQAHPIQAAGPTNPPGGQITSEVLDLLRARIDRNRAENGEPEYQAAAHAGYPSPMMTLAQQPLVCDNKSMVNKVNVISKYTTIFPNSTMASELVGWLVKHPTGPRARGLISRVSNTSVMVLKSRGPTVLEVLGGPLLYYYDSTSYYCAMCVCECHHLGMCECVWDGEGRGWWVVEG